MMETGPFLKGKKGLIVGIANANSIAFGCARALHQAGAELLVSYGSAKSKPYIEPLLPELGHPEAVLCDVRDEAQMAALFELARRKWGTIDFLWCTRLRSARVAICSAA